MSAVSCDSIVSSVSEVLVPAVRAESARAFGYKKLYSTEKATRRIETHRTSFVLS